MGYQAKISDFVQATNECSGGISNEGSPVNIDSSSPAFMKICPTLVLLINIVNGKMHQTMDGFNLLQSSDFIHSAVI